MFADTINLMFLFLNRTKEIIDLDRGANHGGLLVLFGRRRVGKTRLLTEWIKRHNGLYSQAIESDPHTQLSQIFEDIKPFLKTEIVPKTWSELFEIIELQGRKTIFCIDEFPYLVTADSSVPSIFQKWLDHRKNRNVVLTLAGSSTHMMNSIFLNRSAPLYGRADKLLKIEPMEYNEFCKALRLSSSAQESFVKYSMVGGIPKYWELIDRNHSPIDIAESLYFDYAPFMENEPKRILADEKIAGLGALSLLEVIGRGAEKPSEMAARMGTVQTNLSKLLQNLLDTSILCRDIPFGQSTRAAKKTIYRISDPTIRFWFRTYSPHRVLWRTYDRKKKLELLNLHASTVFEDHCRTMFPEGMRYWDKNAEIDLIRPSQQNDSEMVVSEIKFRSTTPAERKSLNENLAERWARTEIAHKYKRARFEILDLSVLQRR